MSLEPQRGELHTWWINIKLPYYSHRIKPLHELLQQIYIHSSMTRNGAMHYPVTLRLPIQALNAVGLLRFCRACDAKGINFAIYVDSQPFEKWPPYIPGSGSQWHEVPKNG